MFTKLIDQFHKCTNRLVLSKVSSSFSELKWLPLVLVLFTISGCSQKGLGGSPTQTGEFGTALSPTPTIHNVEPAKPITSSIKKANDDFDGDGKTDPAKFDLENNTVWWLKSSSGTWDGLWLGNESYTYVSGSDFDGDGKTDPAKFIPSTGTVWWFRSSDGNLDGKWLGSDSFTYVSGSDFDGDGKTDPAKYDDVTHTLSWLNMGTGTWTNIDMGAGTYTLVNGR
jgi:hypothetical protein